VNGETSKLFPGSWILTVTDHSSVFSGRQYGETISHLQQVALQLSTRPETYPMFRLRLLPLSIERSAILAALEMEERHSLDAAQTEFDEESDKVDEEFKRGRDKVRERLLEGIEERRKRAREEKEGEGTVGGEPICSPIAVSVALTSVIFRCFSRLTDKIPHYTQAAK